MADTTVTDQTKSNKIAQIKTLISIDKALEQTAQKAETAQTPTEASIFGTGAASGDINAFNGLLSSGLFDNPYGDLYTPIFNTPTADSTGAINPLIGNIDSMLDAIDNNKLDLGGSLLLSQLNGFDPGSSNMFDLNQIVNYVKQKDFIGGNIGNYFGLSNSFLDFTNENIDPITGISFINVDPTPIIDPMEYANAYLAASYWGNRFD